MGRNGAPATTRTALSAGLHQHHQHHQRLPYSTACLQRRCARTTPEMCSTRAFKSTDSTFTTVRPMGFGPANAMTSSDAWARQQKQRAAGHRIERSRMGCFDLPSTPPHLMGTTLSTSVPDRARGREGCDRVVRTLLAVRGSACKHLELPHPRQCC